MSESLEKLHNRILSDARLKADQMLKEANEKAKQILDTAQQEAQKEAEDIISRARIEAEAVRRGILSSKLRANRLRVLDEKNQILDDVIRSVEERLSNIAASDEFGDTLKRLVAEAVQALGSDEPIVKVGFRDASKKSLDDLGRALPKGSKFVVEDRPIDGLGGVVASDPKGKFTYNNSFRSRLERLDTQLITLVSSTIFGE